MNGSMLYNRNWGLAKVMVTVLILTVKMAVYTCD